MNDISAEVTSNPADILRKYLEQLPQETVDPAVYGYLDQWALWLAENTSYPPSRTASERACTVCGNPIPVARLDLAPNTVTCSKTCSRRHSQALSAAASKSHRDRQRRAKERHANA